MANESAKLVSEFTKLSDFSQDQTQVHLTLKESAITDKNGIKLRQSKINALYQEYYQAKTEKVPIEKLKKLLNKSKSLSRSSNDTCQKSRSLTPNHDDSSKNLLWNSNSSFQKLEGHPRNEDILKNSPWISQKNIQVSQYQLESEDVISTQSLNTNRENYQCQPLDTVTSASSKSPKDPKITLQLSPEQNQVESLSNASSWDSCMEQDFDTLILNSTRICKEVNLHSNLTITDENLKELTNQVQNIESNTISTKKSFRHLETQDSLIPADEGVRGSQKEMPFVPVSSTAEGISTQFQMAEAVSCEEMDEWDRKEYEWRFKFNPQRAKKIRNVKHFESKKIHNVKHFESRKNRKAMLNISNPEIRKAMLNISNPEKKIRSVKRFEYRKWTRSLLRKFSYGMLHLPSPVFRFLLWCKYVARYLSASDRFRVLLTSATIFMCILLLSIPHVPERMLGIRSPQRVLEMFVENQDNSSNVSLPAMLQAVHNNSHSLHKRHIPHKFWAKARPHNKFRKKRRNHRPPLVPPVQEKEHKPGLQAI
ncbi:hypothetical protein SK128_000674 [Halocaridina rubra]|uniref:Uncharacterized protein n=1 Tax=Halocaridina rubra TaxID=373956 RepID=A0AAN8XM66_HALRR